MENAHPMITRSKAGVFKPKTYTTTVSYAHEPVSLKVALSSSSWLPAMQDEYRALLQNRTWSLTSLPSGAKVVGCKWIFKKKFNADGTFQRHKARLVAKGFTQSPGLDYNETFSPVVKPITIRVVLSHVVSNNWPVHQIDVNNAFLNGDLTEDVYMNQPPGFESSDPTLVCKLHKAIYGLKQAPRSWFTKLSCTLEDLGFHSTKSDTSLFIQFTNTSTIFVLIYVDDIIITGSSMHAIKSIISHLGSRFVLKDLGPLHYFLGIEVSKVADGSLHLSQTKYINDLL